MFLVYKTDVNHSYASRDLIGVATSQILAVLICEEKALKEGCNLYSKKNIDAMHMLINKGQTQGYSGDGEFQYERVEIDTLL